MHLKVADLDRSLAFYQGVLGFELTQRMGRQAAFLSAGGYHHHLGLNTGKAAAAPPRHPARRACYHVAIVYPTRALLADALRRLQKAGVPIEGAADHGVSEAIYLRDPDGNGLELLWGPPTAKMAARVRRQHRDVHARPGLGGAAPRGLSRGAGSVVFSLSSASGPRLPGPGCRGSRIAAL